MLHQYDGRKWRCIQQTVTTTNTTTSSSPPPKRIAEGCLYIPLPPTHTIPNRRPSKHNPAGGEGEVWRGEQREQGPPGRKPCIRDNPRAGAEAGKNNYSRHRARRDKQVRKEEARKQRAGRRYLAEERCKRGEGTEGKNVKPIPARTSPGPCRDEVRLGAQRRLEGWQAPRCQKPTAQSGCSVSQVPGPRIREPKACWVHSVPKPTTPRDRVDRGGPSPQKVA